MAIIKEKILTLTREAKGEIFLFGSRARGTNESRSDIDIGVKGMESSRFRQLERNFFDYLEESRVPYEVDLVNFSETPSDFQLNAEKDKILWKVD